jgi:hypothetical protein
MSATGRVGSADSCRTAASHRANAWRSNGSGVLRVASTTSKASADVRHVVSSRRKASALGHACSKSTTRPRSVAGARPKAGRQPTGVVTIPTQNVSPRGSLTIGLSCGPIRKPVSVTRAVPSPTGVCRMASPRTTAATVDPVGAIRSRAPVIRPRANQTNSTKRLISPPTRRGTYSNTARPYCLQTSDARHTAPAPIWSRPYGPRWASRSARCDLEVGEEGFGADVDEQADSAGDGCGLGFVQCQGFGSIAVAVSRVWSMSSVSVIHSSGPMSAPAS